jgi:hypothetical protein
MSLVTCMQELQASRRGNQWHPRVQNPAENRAPYPAIHSSKGAFPEIAAAAMGDIPDTSLMYNESIPPRSISAFATSRCPRRQANKRGVKASSLGLQCCDTIYSVNW